MRKISVALLSLACACSARGDDINLKLRRNGNHLSLEMLSRSGACIVTYRVYYRRIGIIPVYAARPGVDVKGECEIDVPAGRSIREIFLSDRGFVKNSTNKRICARVVYYSYPKARPDHLDSVAACE